MTVTASPQDVPAGTQSAPGTPAGNAQGTLGKGGLLLSTITQLQAKIALTTQPQALANLEFVLNAAQIQAVDYFMASYWVAADQIIAQLCTSPNDIRGPMGPADKTYVTNQLALIAQRQAQVTAAIAAGTPVANPLQYSTAYPPPMSGYPLTLPDAVLYALQTQYVDYLMTHGGPILSAATILADMTGTQTYPWNGYTSDYTSYQWYIDGYGGV